MAGQKPRPKGKVLWTLFSEFFQIALFVVGGGYAIIIVADEVFGKKLKWLEEGELLGRLPIFQMVPGLIAGNSAIYVGLKMAGRLGALVALAAVALPSLAIITLVACGYRVLPLGNPWVESAFLGLRSSLAGIVFGTVACGWRKSVEGVYGYVAMAVASALLVWFHASAVAVLAGAMLAGIALEYAGLGAPPAADAPAGLALKPLSRAGKVAALLALAAAAAAVTAAFGRLFWLFAKFGLLCFGGGFVIVPLYVEEFVGAAAPFLQLTQEEFSNLMAITQITPGPVSVNAATFFGFRMGAVPGAVVATAGLLAPSLFLLTAALTGLERWKSNRCVRGLLRGVRPATVSLMVSAGAVFAGMSVWSQAPGGGLAFSPLALALAAFSAAALMRRWISVTGTIFACAVTGVLARALAQAAG